MIDIIKNKVLKNNLLLSLIVIAFSGNSTAGANIELSLINNNDNASLGEKCVTFERINPAIYVVKVDCERGSYILSLKELYNPGWKVYFSSSSEEESRKINYAFIERYIDKKLESNKNTYKIERKIIPSISNSVLIPDDSHFRMNKIFNGWAIDDQLIKYLLNHSKTDNGLENKKYTLYIVYYSEIIKRIWERIMIAIIALILIVFFTKKIITRIY